MTRYQFTHMLQRLFQKTLLAIVMVLILFPIFWLAVTSIKYPREIATYPPRVVPEEPTAVNYISAFIPGAGITIQSYSSGTNALIYLRNSIIVTTLATIISLAAGIPAGYSIARFNTGGKHLAFWIISTRMAPPVALMIPIFTVLRSVNLVNTHLGVVLPTLIITLPFVVWLMDSFFREIPRELEEQALIDGASRFEAFYRIILPVTKAGVVTAALFSIFFSWNNLIFPLILAYTKDVHTIPILIAGYRGAKGILYGEMSAVTFVTMTPIVAFAIAIQRNLIRGLTLGAVKG